jgi:hypothetical protein
MPEKQSHVFKMVLRFIVEAHNFGRQNVKKILKMPNLFDPAWHPPQGLGAPTPAGVRCPPQVLGASQIV